MAAIMTSLNDTVGAGIPTEMKAMDANRYATKKTIAQGMLDIALLTANASQLRYILQIGEKHEFYKLMLTLISLSIILQLSVGILFVVIGSLNINRKKDQTAAVILNDVILIIIFIISLVNIITGVLLISLTLVSLHKNPTHRALAEHLNHITVASVFLSLFCDIIKMTFGFEPAVHLERANNL